MRKSLLILLSMGLLLSFWGCTSVSPQALPEESRTYESYVIESNNHYQIIKLSLSDYAYEIYNAEGVVIEYETFHGNVPPTIEDMGNNILAIEYYYGPGVREHFFYDLEKELFSERYQSVIKYDSKNVVYLSGNLEERFVAVHGLFDATKGRTETFIDFAPEVTPVVSAEYINDGMQLEIRYCQRNTEEIGIAIIDMPESTGDGFA